LFMISISNVQEQIKDAVTAVKNTTPLAGSITNSVTINLVANAQLAVGGSAAMVYMPDEGEFLAKAGGSLYINVGTILPVYTETLPTVARTLWENHKPWVLDPVAIGIGALRTALLKRFKKFKPSIIRGNASEIIALAGLWGLDGGTEESKVRGVDSTDAVRDAEAAAVALAQWTEGAVAVSGQIDLVTDGKVVAFSHGGSELMEKITGAGCSLGGVMAVYAAVASPFIAALTGTNIYNLAGQRAEAQVRGPGHFQPQFLDELYNATPIDVASNEITLKEV
jgi:hydroxyethylthiazole kinase